MISGCNSFGQKANEPVDTYCEKHFALKKSQRIRKDIKKISKDFFEYVKINETTFICDCPTIKTHKQKQQCYSDFLNLEKDKK